MPYILKDTIYVPVLYVRTSTYEIRTLVSKFLKDFLSKFVRDFLSKFLKDFLSKFIRDFL